MRNPLPLDAPEALNAAWSLDFAHDALDDGRPFRILEMLDDGDPEGAGMMTPPRSPADGRSGSWSS